jgi:4-amino-4-deoxy-L-arabinose transferase-like glycosyltransferase
MDTADDAKIANTANWVDSKWFSAAILPKLIFTVLLIIFGLSLLPRTFWAENEAYYALGAGSVLRGNFLLPVIYDNMLSDKPPLMFWWVALISSPLGYVSEASARIANLIPAFAILLGLYQFARTLGLRAALLAAVILATSHEFYEVAFEVNTDIMLTALLLFSWIALFRIMNSGFTWKRWLMLWVPMGLGLLTKGPVAPALSCLIAVAFAFPRYGLRDGWRCLLSLRPFTGAIVCFLPFVAWCVAVYSQHGREPLDIILLRHNVQRFVEAFDHQKPWFYYLYTLPIVMLPWTLLAPLLISQLWKLFRAKEQLPAWKSFALTVVTVVFLLFTFSSSKRAYYLLPLMPWLALLLGDSVSQFAAAREGLQKRRVQHLTIIAGIGMLVILFFYISVGYQLLDSRRTITALVNEVDKNTAKADTLVLFAEEDPRVIYYLGEKLTYYYADEPEPAAKLAEVLAEQKKVDVVSLERPLKRLLEISPVPLYIEGSALYRGNRFYIVTTQNEYGLSKLTPEFIRNAKKERKKQREN